MSAWPDTMTVGPIREWPGALTPPHERRRAPFRATQTATLNLLTREIHALAGYDAELLVAIPVDKFRLDGRPRAGAIAEHPGVVFSLGTPYGHLSYPADSFLTWEDNLRAVALALEALRKVDRYGVTRRGEQYRGFLAIEAAASLNSMSVEEALRFIAEAAGSSPAVVRSMPGPAVRAVQRTAHPDRGGNADAWHSLQRAERALREAGLL